MIYGDNAFAFEPEYSASEVDERLRAYQEEDDSDDENNPSVELEDGWCTCEKCVHMENPAERVCCRSFANMIGEKFGTEKCIAMLLETFVLTEMFYKQHLEHDRTRLTNKQ